MSDEWTDEDVLAFAIRMRAADEEHEAARAREIGAQPGLSQAISAALSRELVDIGVGTGESRATFAQEVDQAWRIFNIERKRDERDDALQTARYLVLMRIIAKCEELLNLQNKYLQLFKDEHRVEELGSYYIDFVEGQICDIEDGNVNFAEILDMWRQRAPLFAFRRRTGRPHRPLSELRFAIALATAWQTCFDQPAGTGSQARFARFYSSLCEQLGLRPIGGPRLARTFNARYKLRGERLGAERRGRPTKKPHKPGESNPA